MTKDNCQKTICFAAYLLKANYKLRCASAELAWLSILLTCCHCRRAVLTVSQHTSLFTQKKKKNKNKIAAVIAIGKHSVENRNGKESENSATTRTDYNLPATMMLISTDKLSPVP